jgi:hypothetical protein
MTNQGVVSITESGVTIQSRAIEGDLLQLTGPSFINFSYCCHAISYESERLYILGMPTETSDTYATQAWCFNWVTNAWTRWPIDIAAGIVNPFDNKLYSSRPTTNRIFVYQERKNYDYTDFVDDIFIGGTTGDGIVTGISADGFTVYTNSLPIAPYTWVGWALEQNASTTGGIAIIKQVIVGGGPGGANQIVLDAQNSTTPGKPIAWQVGAYYNIDVPIPVTFTSAPITAGFPHYMKDWTRVNFWFNSGNFNYITLGFISDIQGPNTYPVIYSVPAYANTVYAFGFGGFGSGPFSGTTNIPQAIQTLVPTDAAKAHWIQGLLAISFPYVRLSFLGITATYEIDSDVTG